MPISGRKPSVPQDPDQVDGAVGGRSAGGALIVGYGNPLRTDDGVGPAVAELLAADPRLRGADVRAEHQLTPELAIDASRVALLVLVDAMVGVAAGEVVVRDLGVPGPSAATETGPAGRGEGGGLPLTHHIGPASLLALAAELWGSAPRTVLVGVGPASLALGDTLTPAVAAAVPRAVDAVVAAVSVGIGAASSGSARADSRRQG